ncbi:ATP-dependent DNA helicase PcrA [Chthonomonas calidirosea]|uniref:ATP-dependent DNA helicase n=1 Tax=Chthonomonas calidirosea (strain DSM 23976 / ICMP 18418 / T49) TaxID=1303518 RepID=S0EVZ4_CHTCT|nr:DNA helicase PcrA [Chthonomonas calidirosea]CCW36002.1 ATP-dependent DNA helicase PcrA [Chthonomonas calidirosea T49]CEK18619.1 ATP-dependent DNA helicase PcrA [Chthonomonas calidirosea]
MDETVKPAEPPFSQPDANSEAQQATQERLLQGLNPVQREAVLHAEGPLLLFAGAGSGKTRVLTHRIAYLTAVRRVPPQRILAVTFTNKAAKEMKERLDHLVGGKVGKKLWVGTFHAICARLLREFAPEAGLSHEFVVYDDSDQVSLVKECLRAINLDESKFPPRTMLDRISRAKESLIPPEEWDKHYSGYLEEIAGRIYRLYQQKLRQNNALDFDDLLTETVRLLQNNTGVLQHLQDRWRYLLVDEYQDVNLVQYLLLKLLAQKHRNLCVVGDDDQSIYSWRGADVNLILRFEKDYPDAKVLKLEQNYRSTRRILDAAYAVVSNNKGRKEKRLWTENPEGPPLTKYEAATERLEAEWVVNTITMQVQSGKRKWSDFAVLYRTNAQSRVLEEMLRAWAVPYRIVGGLRFYDRKEIKDALAYLRVVHNPNDSVSLKRIINVPARGIGNTTLAKLEAETLLAGSSLWEVLGNEQVLTEFNTRTRKNLSEFRELILGLRALRDTLSVHDLLKTTLERSGYLQALHEENSLEAQGRLENLAELLQAAVEFEATTESPTLAAFLESTALVSDIDSLEEGVPAVTLMTLHAAKGLEFPVVFLTGLEEGVFPHMRSLEKSEQLEEERRLCYVGITRAKEELYLSCARQRSQFLGTAYNPPSRFLKEIPETLFAFNKKPCSRSSLSTFDPDREAGGMPSRLWQEGPRPPSEAVRQQGEAFYRAGQRVRHPQFGEGVVLRVSGEGDDAIIEIAFPNVGPRRLMLSYAKLERVR